MYYQNIWLIWSHILPFTEPELINRIALKYTYVYTWQLLRLSSCIRHKHSSIFFNCLCNARSHWSQSQLQGTNTINNLHMLLHQTTNMGRKHANSTNSHPWLINYVFIWHFEICEMKVKFRHHLGNFVLVGIGNIGSFEGLYKTELFFTISAKFCSLLPALWAVPQSPSILKIIRIIINSGTVSVPIRNFIGEFDLHVDCPEAKRAVRLLMLGSWCLAVWNEPYTY